MQALDARSPRIPGFESARRVRNSGEPNGSPPGYAFSKRTHEAPSELTFLIAHQFTMTIIQPGADAPAFELDSHDLESKVKSADFAGSKAMLLVFYPLDFTPT